MKVSLASCIIADDPMNSGGSIPFHHNEKIRKATVMIKAVELTDGIFRISANIGSRDLFEGIWPIPNGVSLNSYIVRGDKTALIDMVKDWEGAVDEITVQLKSLQIQLEDIDFLVLNHMEPDHTGWLAELRRRNPAIRILCSKKAVPLVKAFYGIEDNVQAVGTGDTLDLGGRKLVFVDTPNIHWPETMMTFEPEAGVLFSCDAFGAFGKVGEAVFDDQLSTSQHQFFERETLRYYANIVSAFSPFVERGIKKLENENIRIIAPSHGIIWRENPKKIIGDYLKLASYMNGPAEQEVTLVWSSMYGNTEALLDSVIKGVEAENIPVTVHRVPQEHASFVLASAWKSSGLIIGTPTYEYKMFPPMYAILDILDRSHVYNRKAMRFGSYGWSGGAQKQYDEFSKSLKWDCIGTVEYQGAPTEVARAAGFQMARELAVAVKNWK